MMLEKLFMVLKTMRPLPWPGGCGFSLPAYCLAIGLFTGGCGLLQTVPVDKESYLLYRISRGSGGASQVTLRFKNAARNMIEVIVEQPAATVNQESRARRENGGFPDSQDFQETPERVIFPDENGKILVSRFFTRKGGSRLEIENFGPLWLPITMLAPGRTLNLGYSAGTLLVEPPILWNDRRVVPLKTTDSKSVTKGVWFYSTDTGFLAGFESQEQLNGETGSPDSPALLLVGTNIGGLLAGGE